MITKKGTHVSLLDQIVGDEILKENESDDSERSEK